MEDNAARSQMLQDYASVRDALGEGAASREFAKDMIARIKQALGLFHASLFDAHRDASRFYKKL